MTIYRVDHLFVDGHGNGLELRTFSKAATFAVARALTASSATAIASTLVPGAKWVSASGPCAGVPGVTHERPATLRAGGRWIAPVR